MLGFGDKALEFYKMINPIEHSKSKEIAQKYKVEPYVLAADIYGIGNLAGQGGWTWYTGSSSWYYIAGIEYILGLKIEKGFLTINPCIPKEWKEYVAQLKWKNSIYNIKVSNQGIKNVGNNGANSSLDLGIQKVLLNGKEVLNKIKLEDSGVYNIIVEQ